MYSSRLCLDLALFPEKWWALIMIIISVDQYQNKNEKSPLDSYALTISFTCTERYIHINKILYLTSCTFRLYYYILQLWWFLCHIFNVYQDECTLHDSYTSQRTLFFFFPSKHTIVVFNSRKMINCEKLNGNFFYSVSFGCAWLRLVGYCCYSWAYPFHLFRIRRYFECFLINFYLNEWIYLLYPWKSNLFSIRSSIGMTEK